MNDHEFSAGRTLRAGRRILRALTAHTGPRLARRARLGLPLALLCSAGLGAAAMAAASAEGAADPDRERIEGIVRDYILAHPEILPQAMERLQQRKVARTIEDNRAALETPYAGAWEGAKDGDVVLVEFYDYACSYCRTARADIDRLVREDPRLKIVYRQLPILGADSAAAGRVGLFAAEQGRYPAFHRAMYEGGDASRAGVLAAAARAGLDRSRVDAILGSRATPPEFEQNVTLARAIEATGTPTFVVGNEMLAGVVGYDALKEAIARARAAGGQRTAKARVVSPAAP